MPQIFINRQNRHPKGNRGWLPFSLPPQYIEAWTKEGRQRSQDWQDTTSTDMSLLQKDIAAIHPLDYQHYALRSMFGSDALAPLPENTQQIIDIGCGTGRWVMEMARRFPLARVMGIDTEVPVFTTTPLSNCSFYRGDVLEGLPFPANHFQFVHQRLRAHAIPTAQWPSALHELVRVTCPDGYVELGESGERYHQLGPVHRELLEWCHQDRQQAGFDLSIMTHLDKLLQQAGLTDITRHTIEIPLGRWGGEVGTMMAAEQYAWLQNNKDIFVSRLGVREEIFKHALTALPQEWETYHTTYEFFLAYGRKAKA